VLAEQLQEVAVAGDDAHVHALRLGLRCDGADHVVGLVALQFQDGDVEGGDQVADAVNLEAQVVGHLVARALVVRVQIAAPGKALVEGHGQIVGVLVEQVEQGTGEAVDGIGRLAGFGLEALQRQGEEHAIGQRVAVN